MIPVDEIRFPAITVNSDSIANPWGFIEKSFNMLAFDYGLSKYTEESKKLREDFKFLTYKIIFMMYEQLYAKKIGGGENPWTLKDLKSYKDKRSNVRINKAVCSLSIVYNSIAISVLPLAISKYH